MYFCFESALCLILLNAVVDVNGSERKGTWLGKGGCGLIGEKCVGGVGRRKFGRVWIM